MEPNQGDDDEISDELLADYDKWYDFLLNQEYKVRSLYLNLGIAIIAFNWAVLTSGFLKEAHWLHLVSICLALVTVVFSFAMSKLDAMHIRVAYNQALEEKVEVDYTITSKPDAWSKRIVKVENWVFVLSFLAAIVAIPASGLDINSQKPDKPVSELVTIQCGSMSESNTRAKPDNSNLPKGESSSEKGN